MKYIASTFTLITILLLVTQCNKNEGFGGNNTIKGQIIKQTYNYNYSILLKSEPAVDEDVFLYFGSDLTPADKIETGFNGQFEFKYLFDGTYSVVAYTKDSLSSLKSDIPKITKVSVNKRDTKNIGTIYISETVDYNDGAATICGKVYVLNYKNSTTYPDLEVKDITLAQEVDVYIVYNNQPFYTDRTRTGFDGTFCFPNLIKGPYSVYVYSEDITGGTANIPIFRNITINSEFDSFILDDIIIEKL